MADAVASFCGNGDKARFARLFVCRNDIFVNAKNFQHIVSGGGVCDGVVCL